MDKKHKNGNKTSDNKKTETKNHILEEIDVPQIKDHYSIFILAKKIEYVEVTE